jgi:signal transduction histidine kinase
MKFWNKKNGKDVQQLGVARAALRGATPSELMQQAVESIALSGEVSRVGVWLESEGSASDLNNPAVFHGVLWDDQAELVPAEWSHLSPEAPLPHTLLLGGVSVPQDLGDSPEIPVIGPLVGLQHVLWVPIEKKHHLRGVILLGTRKKQAHLPRILAESISAELELALEFAEKRHLAVSRQADMALGRRTLSSLDASSSLEYIFSDLAVNCTLSTEKSGPGAVFAAIGVPAAQGEDSHSHPHLVFSSKSGPSEWTRALDCEPLSGVWHKALETQRVVGSDPGVTWSRGEVARVVAIPLHSNSESHGVLVVGLPPGIASLATLERLEYRAALASLALQKQIEQNRKASQSLWQRQLLEENLEPALLLDSSGSVISMSRGAVALLSEPVRDVESFTNSDSARLPFASLFNRQSQNVIDLWCRNLFAGKFSSQNLPEAELRTGLHIRIRSAIPSDGGFVAVTLDTLQRPQNAETTERAELELQSVLEWLEEGVVLFDAHENVRVANTRFEQLAGLAPHESGNCKTLDDWIARLELQAADPTAFAERWRELARGVEVGGREEIQMSRPAPRILERASRVVLNAAGKRLGRLEIYRDLTAQRVFQSKLLQTEKLAALGQMVTGVAHELSSPLTSILGYAQRLLLREDLLGKSAEAQKIVQEAERASSILRQLLYTAREAPPERRPVALNQVVQRAIELQAYGTATEKVTVKLDLDPVLPYVLGDAGQLQQVLMNLVGNARQAIEQQGKPGTILLRTRRTGERFIQMQVIDDGPGIPQSIQARVFDPFFTTKPAGVGTGLGLSIVLGIVREHGGRVQLSTPPEGGACFLIELPALASTPLWQEQEASISRARPARRVPPETSMLGGTLAPVRTETDASTRILVVEDEPTVARLIADVLEEEGFRVDVLLDGREALELVRRETFDLVICDMKMPGIDGQHFYNSLSRAANPLADHFLFVTGDVIGPHTHEFLARHHLPHVAKPFRVEELTEKVRRMLPKIHHGEIQPAAVKRNVAGNG